MIIVFIKNKHTLFSLHVCIFEDVKYWIFLIVPVIVLSQGPQGYPGLKGQRGERVSETQKCTENELN